MKTTELKTYSFTEEDIDLITYSLRLLGRNAFFQAIKDDAGSLLEYIERQKQEHLDEKVKKAFESK